MTTRILRTIVTRISYLRLGVSKYSVITQLNGGRICASFPERSFSTEMAKNSNKKAVVFDLGGVVFEPPQNAISRYGVSIGLPGSFLEGVLIRGMPDNTFCKMERGELTARQFTEHFEKECREAAKKEGVTLPPDFNTRTMFDAFMDLKLVPEIINAVAVLRQHGFKTAALTNNYIDDREQNALSAGVMTALSSFHFDHFIESCRFGQRKPHESIFKEALRKLEIKAEEMIFLDDIGSNLKAAKGLGISTILVKDKNAALKELQEITNVDVFQEAKPIKVHPDKVPHSYAVTRSGVKFHYVDMGTGPPVILCHGFPESWYEWKTQIPALVGAGFRVIALDMKGYGQSSNPPEIEEYSQERMCKDMAEFMDALCLPQATLIGHDWGGALVWTFAMHYADRVSHVAGICTPMMPPNNKSSPLERIKKDPGVFDYQLYFQEPGVAEAELEANLEKFVKTFFRRPQERDPAFSVADVRKRGGLLVGVKDDITLSSILTEEDLEYYVKQMKTSGLRGMLNWYRNIEQNWKYNHRAMGRKLYMPALMVTCGLDRVLSPAMSKAMEPWVVNLSRGHIEDSGHWAALEKPRELNKILVDWLLKVHGDSTRPIIPSSL
ncbi:bifunctional epoxide hydrolase 2-like [Diadema antillarum]|uniref:bifunctional epoxide hydrolase 2-like n=1 Tax=Diadema antillarum TaxID=105358 RepID=UPI003A8C01BB